MKQIAAWLISAVLLFTLQACGPKKSVKKEMPAEPVSEESAELSTREDMARLRAENIDLRQQLAYMKKVSKETLEACEQQLETAESELQTLRGEAPASTGASRRMGREIRPVAPTPTEARKEESKRLKIKVLSGDGDLASARTVRKQLEEMGYRVDAVGLAPRADFKRTTVYIKPGHKSLGKSIASKLGENTVTLPLTWSSVFDVIIVTGRAP